MTDAHTRNEPREALNALLVIAAIVGMGAAIGWAAWDLLSLDWRGLLAVFVGPTFQAMNWLAKRPWEELRVGVSVPEVLTSDRPVPRARLSAALSIPVILALALWFAEFLAIQAARQEWAKAAVLLALITGLGTLLLMSVYTLVRGRWLWNQAAA